MKAYTLDEQALIGGVIAEDADQQIVHLHLQKDNELPPYAADVVITFITITGQIRIGTDEHFVDANPLQIVRLEPNEQHTVQALADHTHVIVVKQLCHHRAIAKQLRFGQCCLNLE